MLLIRLLGKTGKHKLDKLMVYRTVSGETQ